ncbi:hypothetical protein AgCh_007425 [Apium graveolens]
MFYPSAALVGEGLWDETNNFLVIVACTISSANSSGDAHVGDCSFRLSLYHPSVWSTKNRDRAVGQIWTNKTAQRSGTLARSDLGLPVKTSIFQVFRMNTLLFKKEKPIFIGNELYAHSSVKCTGLGGYEEIAESEVEFEKFDSDNVPVNLVISAEGVYDAGTGLLCMVGCRNLLSSNSLDCDIVLNFQFPRLIKTKGDFLKGSMQSTRKQSDPLFFECLNMTSSSSISYEALRSVWRIDLGIAMMLIVSTNVCIFVCFQLYQAIRYSKS